MSYANGTQFYNLPQTVGTDKRDWFDTNSPFAAIDAALHAAVVGQAADAEAIATINGKLADDEADIAALQTKGNTHDSQIAALQTTVNTQANQISDVRQDAEDMITANNEGAAATSTRAYAIGDYFIYNDVLYKAIAAIAVGDTIVPNTNCEATNVDTELTQVNSDLNIKGTITRDNNWDNITQGRYNVNTWSGTDTPSNNYPSHRGMGLLEVIGDENNNITQKVMFTNGYFYYRIKNSGTWSEWVLVDTNSPVETLSPTIGAKVTNHITFTRIGHKLILTGYFQVTSAMEQGDVIANFGDTIAPTVNQGVMIFGTSGTTGLHPLSFRKTSGGTTLTVGENVSTGYYNISALFIIS